MRRKNYLGNWSVAILTLLGRTSQDLPKMESVKSVAFVVQKTNMCCCFFVVCFILFFFFFFENQPACACATLWKYFTP